MLCQKLSQKKILFFIFSMIACAGTPMVLEKRDLDASLPSEMIHRFVPTGIKASQEEGQDPQKSQNQIAAPASSPLPSSPVLQANQKYQKHQKVGAIASRESLPLPEKPFEDQEKLTYGIFFLGAYVGELELSELSPQMMDGAAVYHYQAFVKSSPFFNLFYRFEDVIRSFVGKKDLLPKRLEIHLSESGQAKESLEIYDLESKRVFYEDVVVKSGKPPQNQSLTSELFPNTQNGLSAFYYLRFLSLKVGNLVSFPLMNNGKKFEATLEVIRKENLKNFLNHDIECALLRLEVREGSVMKSRGINQLWVSWIKKIPIQFEFQLKIGHVKGVLQKADEKTRLSL